MIIDLFPAGKDLLDGIQIFLCGVIVIFLICNRIQYKRMMLKTAPRDPSAAFHDLLCAHALKQQTEQCFDAISDFIDRQRHSLQPYYEAGENQHAPQQQPVLISDGHDELPPLQPTGNTARSFSAVDAIMQLSETGLTTRAISQKVNIARGEVELILRLNRKGVGADHRSKSGAQALAGL